MQWAAWLSIVLGLPYNATGSDAIMLATDDAVAEGMIDHVPTLDELRRARRGGS